MDDLPVLPIATLWSQLAKRGLKTTGTKEELTRRLKEAQLVEEAPPSLRLAQEAPPGLIVPQMPRPTPAPGPDGWYGVICNPPPPKSSRQKRRRLQSRPAILQSTDAWLPQQTFPTNSAVATSTGVPLLTFSFDSTMDEYFHSGPLFAFEDCEPKFSLKGDAFSDELVSAPPRVTLDQHVRKSAEIIASSEVSNFSGTLGDATAGDTPVRTVTIVKVLKFVKINGCCSEASEPQSALAGAQSIRISFVVVIRSL